MIIESIAIKAVGQLLLANEANALLSAPESSKAKANCKTDVRFRKLLPQGDLAGYLSTIHKLQPQRVLFAVKLALNGL